jgi:hypothetical protein
MVGGQWYKRVLLLGLARCPRVGEIGNWGIWEYCEGGDGLVPKYAEGGEGLEPILGDGGNGFLDGAIDGLAENGRELAETRERYHSGGYGQGSVFGMISESGIGGPVDQSDGGPNPS